MSKFIVHGVPPFDGEYPIEVGAFTMRELQIIKRMSGVRAGELEEAFTAGDSDVILAVAVIAVRRNGKDWQAFETVAWESEMGQITFVAEEAADVTPLVMPPRPSSDETEASPESSGQRSSPLDDGVDLPETSLRAIGSPS